MDSALRTKNVPTWHTIELCSGCGGSGRFYTTPIGGGGYYVTCRQCNGSGRVEVTTTRTEKPFGSSPEEV